MKKFVVFAFGIIAVSCQDSPQEKIIERNGCYITHENTAVKVAEAIAMETYGVDKIKSERPYNVTIVNDSLWKIEGTSNSIGFGGTFSITLSAKDGRVVEMFHGK